LRCLIQMPGRPGRRSQRMANITVTLTVGVLDKIDNLVDQDDTLSRSRLIREAVEKYVKSL
jgi:metal-responsive CopG/Arc/MetJ family transcriptional regulator